MSRLVGIYGASGFGREIAPLFERQADGSSLLFIDDGSAGTCINGLAVVNWQEFLEAPAERRAVCIAIADSAIRERLADRCAAAGVEIVGIRADRTVVMDDVTIGEGAVLSPFVTLTSNIRIGRCFHANIYSYVAHDCVIGDFVTFAPRVSCNGNVHIEDHAYIGTGAVIRQGAPGKPLVIGRGAVVGMGAVVTRDVAAGTTVVGNPARPLIRD